MILSGKKKEEYREIKSYWQKRLIDKKYDVIKFRNGYSKTAPSFVIEYLGVCGGLGLVRWGAPENKQVYILKLGKILKEETE